MENKSKVVMARRVDNSKPRDKNPEEKEYLICIVNKNGTDYDWDIIEGRTNVYEYIKEEIEFIDLEKSFVLVESLPLSGRKTIYAFMKYVQEFYEDSFDIEDYVIGDMTYDEEDDSNHSMSDISSAVSEVDRLDMRSFMNGDIKSSSLE